MVSSDCNRKLNLRIDDSTSLISNPSYCNEFTVPVCIYLPWNHILKGCSDNSDFHK